MCPSSGIYRDRVKSQLNIPCVGVVVLYTGIYLPDIPVYTVYTVPIHYILLYILYVPVTWLAEQSESYSADELYDEDVLQYYTHYILV